MVQSESGETSQLVVDDRWVQPLSARPPLREYLKSLVRLQPYIWRDAVGQAFTSGQNTYLGRLWLFLNPLLQVAVFALVFGVLLKTSRGVDNFLGFLTIGVIFFGFMSAGITKGPTLVRGSQGLLRSFDFPGAILSLSLTVRAFLDNAIPATLAILMALAFQWGSPISWTIILVIPLYILMHVFIAGCALTTSRIGAFVPDFKSVMGVVMRGLFFLSGIFYDIQRFDDKPLIRDIMSINPLYQFLTAFREVVLTGGVPSLERWGYLTLWAFGLFAVGLVFVWRGEPRYKSVR